MVKRCVAGGCSNAASAGVSLHHFPVDEEVRSAWTSAVKLTRDGWAGPTSHSVLCSEHFPAECFEQQTSEFAREMMSGMGITYRRRTSLKADAVPVLFSASNMERSTENEPSENGTRFSRKQWKNLNHMSIPAAADTLIEHTETTIETDSDGVPELVYFVGEENDPTEASDDSSDPGDMDSGEDLDPENEPFLEEELQTESDEETSEDEDFVPEHGELCTDCGTFSKKKKPHTCEHKIKPLPCNICGKRFANELTLAVHTRMHSTDYEFSCKYCHVKFKSRFNKTTHEQIHLTEEKPYKCPKCSETFARRPEYKTHLEGHRGPTPLKCHICGIEFSNSSGLKRHLVVHSVEKPYKCPVCTRGFTQAGNLKVHMRQHTGEKPFRCQHCDKTFSHNVSLKSHVKRFHTPSSESQQKTKRRKRDRGDSRANGNMEVADSLLFEAEQETDEAEEQETDEAEQETDEAEQETDDVQSKQKSRGKTNEKNTVRPKGRPKRKTAGSLRIKQGSDTSTAK